MVESEAWRAGQKELIAKADEARKLYDDKAKIYYNQPNIAAENLRREQLDLPLIRKKIPYYRSGDAFLSVVLDAKVQLAFDFAGNMWHRGKFEVQDGIKKWSAGFLCDLEGNRIENSKDLTPPANVALPIPKRPAAY